MINQKGLPRLSYQAGNTLLASLRFFSWVKSLKRQRRNRKACQHHNECDCQLGCASSENKHFRNRSKPVSSPDYGGKHRLQTTDQKESWRQAPSLTNWLPTLWVAELVSSFFVQGESDTFRVRRTAKLQKSQCMGRGGHPYCNRGWNTAPATATERIQPPQQLSTTLQSYLAGSAQVLQPQYPISGASG